MCFSFQKSSCEAEYEIRGISYSFRCWCTTSAEPSTMFLCHREFRGRRHKEFHRAHAEGNIAVLLLHSCWTKALKCYVIATFGLFTKLNCLLQQPHLCFIETMQLVFNIYAVWLQYSSWSTTIYALLRITWKSQGLRYTLYLLYSQ